MTPLNGTKTHPLTAAALAELIRLRNAPRPRQEINPGIANRLEREALVALVDLPSPYKTRKGTVAHLRITDAGRAALEAIRDLPESMINHPSYVNGEWSRRNIEAFVDAALDNGKVDR